MIARVPDSGSPLAWRARLVILALGLTVAWACAAFLSGLLGAVVLAVVCTPAYRRLRRHFGERTTAFALTVGAAGLLVAPAVWLVATAIEEAPGALQRAASSAAVARLSAPTIVAYAFCRRRWQSRPETGTTGQVLLPLKPGWVS